MNSKSNKNELSLGERIKCLAANPKTSLTANQIRIIVAIERAVARLEAGPILRNHLIFKGGCVLLKTIESGRFTRDLERTPRTEPSRSAIEFLPLFLCECQA